jgi:hypothetical protein
MPSRDVLQAYTEAASRRMAEAVQPYYDVVDQFGAGSSRARAAAVLASWDLEQAVRANHIEAAVLGGGGSLSDDAQGVLRDIIGTDTFYVDRFAEDLPKLSRAQALVRANMYVNTQRNTITEITGLELPTLPIYPRDNRLACTWHCKCDLDVRFLFGAGNADVYWNLDQRGGVEHCPDCLRLSASWRPLQIRGGKIVNAKMVRVEDVERIKVALMGRVA